MTVVGGFYFQNFHLKSPLYFFHHLINDKLFSIFETRLRWLFRASLSYWQVLILYYALVSFYSYYSFFILILIIVYLRAFYQYQMLSYGLEQHLLKIVYYYSSFLTVFCYYCWYYIAYYQLYHLQGLQCKSCTSRNYFIGVKAVILAIDSYFVIRSVLSYFAWKMRTHLHRPF